jgi:RHS repeat-associated protein
MVRGNPQGIHELARHWLQQGQAADDAALTLTSAANDIQGGALGLKGDYAPKVQEAIGDLPGELRKLAVGYRGCGQALDTYATKLAEAQRRSGQARSDRDVATGSKRNAEYDLDQLAPGWDAYAQSPTTLRTYLADKPEPTLAAVTRRENADRDVGLADSLARQAAALRGDAEDDCVREIKDALADSGLKNRSWYEKVGDYLKESFGTWDGFVKFCETVSTVLGVIAIFLSGPLALVVGAILIVTAVVAMADKIKKFANGEIGWKELAFEAGMVVLARFGGKALGPAFRRLGNSKVARGFVAKAGSRAGKMAGNLNLGNRARNLLPRAKCLVTGHPVDVATGKVFTEVTDLKLPGPLPFSFDRVWFSTSTYHGPLGHGWHHSYDAALYATADALLYRTPDGRLVELLPLYPGTQFYDRQERITLSRDQAGYRVRDSDGVTHRFAPVTIADPSSEEPVLHVLQDVISRAGQRISLSYDDLGRLARIVDSSGRELLFEHDSQGRFAALSAPHPDRADERFTVARYEYDDLDNLVRVSDALGQAQLFGYDGNLLIRESDRTGLSFSFEYDGPNERARCLHTWGDGGLYDRRLSYQPGLTTVVDSLGHSTVFEHQDGLVIRTVDPRGGESRTDYEYQQPVTDTDALGRKATYEYDHRGNLLMTLAPDGSVVATDVGPLDLPIAVTDVMGQRWTYRYDAVGLLLEKVDPLGRSWSFSYRSGLLTSVLDPGDGVTTITYDEQGLLSAVTTPAAATGGWRHDRLGRTVAIIDPVGNERIQIFDLLGRVTRVEEPDGNVRELGYNGEGDLLTAVDALVEVSFTYQGLGRPSSRTQAGTTVRFEYDTEEQFVAVANEHGEVYRFGHDAAGDVVSERGFDGRLRLYERDLLGRVTSMRRAGGGVSRYDFDAADRVVAVSHPDGGTERFGYRPDGTLVLAENDTLSVRFERDALGRLVREIQGDQWVASDYDARGLRVGVRSSAGLAQLIERDAAGDVSSVRTPDFEVRFGRDAMGLELTRELPGGAGGRWSRDRFGRPVRHEFGTGTGRVRDRRYDWSVDDRLRAVREAGAGPIAFRHDGFGQLAAGEPEGATAQLRMPDALGNLFRTVQRDDRTYGPAGQLLTATDPAGRRIAYSYDPEGNLLSKQAGDGETWAYRWDGPGNLVEVTRPDGTAVTFAYDALGRRVTKTSPAGSTSWVWDGDVPLHEWADGRPITWIFEPETYAPLARLSPDGCEGIVTDHLGTPIAMFDQTGRLTWAGDVSLWGRLTLTEGQGAACPFRWPGQYEDAETGLHYNRFRYYDPEAGQYLSQDPIGLAGGNALYAYVLDPLTWIDPQGLAGEKVYRITPEYINYAQATINKSFDIPGGKIAISKAVSLGRSQVGKFPPIRVQRVNGILVARDGNSRLYIAEATGAKKIKVVFDEDDPALRSDLRARLRRSRLPACGTRGMPTPR